ncbi:hypothetical protein B1810_23920 [Panacagrimonas perspica]|nr:hypothetical protein B1810_23920 [Panacagrimonas perspica]
MTFDPAWIRGSAPTAVETIFYDGQCGLCHRVVRFVLAEDAHAVFRLAPLQGTAFEHALPAPVRARLPDSFLVLTADGRVASRSDAAIHVLERLGGLWRIAGAALRLVPRTWRDRAYDAIGRNRHALFARPIAACPLTPPHLRGRFLA